MTRLLRFSAAAVTLALTACGGGGGGGGGSDDRSGEVFEAGQVLTYRVTMAPADWQYIEDHGVGEEWMPADLDVTGGDGTNAVGQVGFRHKGGYGNLGLCWGPPTIDDGLPGESHDEMLSRPRLDEPFCRKISYKFKFNLYDSERRFLGLKKLNLHSASRDGTMLHELLAYDLFNSFGVDAPRAAPAQLYINDTFMGLFIAVEDIDDRYAEHHYPDADDGNLYKEIWPIPGFLDYYGPGYAEYAAGFMEEGDDPTDFVEFATSVRTAVSTRSTTPLAGWVEIDDLLRYIAVDRAIRNWDGLTAMYTCVEGPLVCGVYPHNFFWYHSTGPNGRFHLVPWDMDNTFQSWDFFIDPHDGIGAERPIPNWNVRPADCLSPIQVWGSTWVMPSGCDPFLNLLASTHWDRFEALSGELLAGPLQTSVLREKAQRWAALIDPIIRLDPVLEYEAWVTERDTLMNQILPALRGDVQVMLDTGYVEQ